MLCVLPFLPFAALAMDADGNYAVWGIGKKSCFSYNNSRKSQEFDTYKNYIMGYLTAYNAVTAETYSISARMNLTEILEWLDDYCELKAMHSFELALSEFLISHKDSRLKQPPTRFGR